MLCYVFFFFIMFFLYVIVRILSLFIGIFSRRRFVQDDAHIFCRFDQIQPIVAECLEFLNEVYLALGFQYRY
jgi:hypothetical protein